MSFVNQESLRKAICHTYFLQSDVPWTHAREYQRRRYETAYVNRTVTELDLALDSAIRLHERQDATERQQRSIHLARLHARAIALCSHNSNKVDAGEQGSAARAEGEGRVNVIAELHRQHDRAEMTAQVTIHGPGHLLALPAGAITDTAQAEAADAMLSATLERWKRQDEQRAMWDRRIIRRLNEERALEGLEAIEWDWESRD